MLSQRPGSWLLIAANHERPTCCVTLSENAGLDKEQSCSAVQVEVGRDCPCQVHASHCPPAVPDPDEKGRDDNLGLDSQDMLSSSLVRSFATQWQAILACQLSNTGS